MTILCEYWNDSCAARQHEMRTAVLNNCALHFVDRVVLFLAHGCEGVRHPKVVRMCEDRPTYKRIFDAAGEWPGVCAVLNTDIFFDLSAEAHLRPECLAGRAYALTRWDMQQDGSATQFRTGGSYDAYVFMSPLVLHTKDSDFTPGINGCDAKLAGALKNTGLSVVNPANTVKAFHLHLSGKRNYDGNERIYGNYHVVPVT